MRAGAGIISRFGHQSVRGEAQISVTYSSTVIYAMIEQHQQRLPEDTAIKFFKLIFASANFIRTPE
jgi:hypothetical protein